MKRTNTLIILLAIIFSYACNKNEFLSEKPNSSIVIPTKLNELRALLDNESVIWYTGILGLESSDEYYWSLADWKAQPIKDQNAYVWAKDVFKGQVTTVKDWSLPYTQIFYANLVLEGLQGIEITPANQKEYQALKGAALFIRGRAFYSLSEIFTLPYDKTTADKDPGLPLKINSNVNDVPQRSSIEATYTQLLADLTAARDLLETKTTDANRLRPTKLAAYGLLARIHLTRREYEQAGKYADSLLMNYNKLIDYNTLTGNLAAQNDEVIFQSVLDNAVMFGTLAGVHAIDSVLYKFYDANDLRKTIFFRLSGTRVTTNVKGNYSGLTYTFSGVATDEMYLIRAESNARAGATGNAMNDLNTLLAKRFKSGTFTPLTAGSAAEALDIVLKERRKELVFRGARWSDVRRLNQEGANITFTRILDGVTYTLPPNDARYALPIPEEAITLSGLEQNIR